MTISRVMVALGGAGMVSTRHNARKGHARSENSTTTTVVSRTNADETRAKPAPGPMYADADSALANRQTSNNAVVSHLVVRQVMTVAITLGVPLVFGKIRCPQPR